MARINKSLHSMRSQTHEGGPAYGPGELTPIQALRRSVLSCLLWEDEFYEDGQSIADRIVQYARLVPPQVLADLAIEARTKYNLRHAPLLLTAVLCQTGSGSGVVRNTVKQVIQRADEITELTAIYAQLNKGFQGLAKSRPTGTVKLSSSLKKGLAAALRKFDGYQFRKYFNVGAEKGKPIQARDILFMTCPKPTGGPKNMSAEEQAALWKQLAENELREEGTWEVELLKGGNKKEVFERLLREGKLGYLALLRNLRNMAQAQVDDGLVREAILARKGADRVLPFRYIAAARAAMAYEAELDQALLACIGGLPQLGGLTALLVDVSGSMEDRLSARSDLTRMDAAAALASVWPGTRRVFTFSNYITEVAPRRGMSGVDAITHSQPNQGTHLGAAVSFLNEEVPCDRLIVITDEQSHDRVVVPSKIRRRYMINVASAQNGVGYGPWVHIDGFSEQVIRFVHQYETGE